jgi:anti-sigma B factor antagonist
MALLLERKSGMGLVTLSGSLDAAAVESFSRQTVAWIEAQDDLRQVVVDLGDVGFMDSAGLGALVGILKRLASRGGDLRLARPRPSVKLVLEITRANKIFGIFATVAEALAPAPAHP